MLAFLITSIVIELTPGPNMTWLAVLGATRGRAAALSAVAGIFLGLAFAGMVAALGLTVLFDNFPGLLTALRYAGTFYLFYLAYDAWTDAGKPDAIIARPNSSYFVQGLISNALNAKAYLFYAAILPQFLTVPDHPNQQLAILTAIYVAVATTIHAGIAILARQHFWLAGKLPVGHACQASPGHYHCACRLLVLHFNRKSQMTKTHSTNIAMWSGPRNISTAMMYSFGNRDDCVAWDEPFYAAYLKETGLPHPMRQEILSAGEQDWCKVAERCSAPASNPVFYQKHMTHHMLKAIDRGFIKTLANAFLIRAPEKVLASYAKKHDEVSLHAIGFVEQAEIFDLVANHLGHAPPVIDADFHLANPRKNLQHLCHALGIPFREAMMKWPKGQKSFDGVWAPHWYNAAWESEGFGPPPKTPAPLPDHLQRIADQASPFYEKLKAHALSA